MSPRLRTYLHGRDGLIRIAVDMLLAWRTVPALARPVWRSFVDLAWDLLPLLLALLGPVLVVLAPVIAIFSSGSEHREAETRARLRRGMHQNGRPQ